MYEDVTLQLKAIMLQVPTNQVKYPAAKAIEAFTRGDQLAGYYWCGALSQTLINIVILQGNTSVARAQEVLMLKLKLSIDKPKGGE